MQIVDLVIAIVHVVVNIVLVGLEVVAASAFVMMVTICIAGRIGNFQSIHGDFRKKYMQKLRIDLEQ